jgi:hypothetical protein
MTVTGWEDQASVEGTSDEARAKNRRGSSNREQPGELPAHGLRQPVEVGQEVGHARIARFRGFHRFSMMA